MAHHRPHLGGASASPMHSLSRTARTLRGWAIGSGMLLLAACGGSASPSAAPPSRAASGAPAAVASISAGAKPAASGAASAKPAAAASGGASAKPATSGKQPSLTVAFSASSATITPLWLADAAGTFAKHGVNVTVTKIASTAMTPAFLNHQVDIFNGSGAGVLTADLNGNLDEVYILSAIANNTAALFATKDIKTGADLKGKEVLTDQPGTPTDYFTRLNLSLAGLKPTDVTLRRVGGSEVSVPAFLAGQGAAVATTPPSTFQLEGQGYPQLANTYKTTYLSGFVAQRSRLDELSAALPGFVLGIRDAIDIYNSNPDMAKQIAQKYLGDTDPATIQKTYDFYKTTVPFDHSGMVQPQSVSDMLTFLSETVPAAKTAKPEQFYDMRFVQQADAQSKS
jgi:NitT/TauT family transport system substrate-binding protein